VVKARENREDAVAWKLGEEPPDELVLGLDAVVSSRSQSQSSTPPDVPYGQSVREYKNIGRTV
jgi:hypothetical protein